VVGNAIVCSRERRKGCASCGRPSTKLCDFDIGGGKTCDRAMCDQHAKRVGPNRDYCSQHQLVEARS
jgi:hypothetical protein